MTEKVKKSSNSMGTAKGDFEKLSLNQPDLIALEIKKAREAANLSHSDLNRITGISRSVLYGYEIGRTKPGSKELRLLCEALKVSPNRLIMGTEEPFKPKTGLRALVKLRNSPFMAVAGMMMFPAVMAILDDDQVEALLLLIASLIEGRDKDLYKKMSVIAEVFGDLVGEGTPADLTRMAELSKDQKFMAELEERISKRISAI